MWRRFYAASVIGGKIVRKARTSANRSVRTVFRKARILGLTVPPSLLALADEVIE